MSVKVMGAVWDTALPRDEKYVLLSYADHAAHDGTSIYPSIARMAWKTGYARRSIQTITTKLIDRGVLIPDGQGWHGTNKYRIDLEALPKREPYGGVQNLHGCRKQQGGVQKTAHGGANSAPNPSLTVSEPPHDEIGISSPAGDEDSVTREWIEELENTIPAPRNPPHSAEELRLQTLEKERRMIARQAEEPCLAWGNNSEEMRRQVQRFGSRAYTVLRLGYELDEALGLRPVWSNPSRVKTWIGGLAACLAETDGDWEMVVKVAREMRENKLNIKNPYSIEGMVADAAAKKRGTGQPGHIKVGA